MVPAFVPVAKFTVVLLLWLFVNVLRVVPLTCIYKWPLLMVGTVGNRR